MTLANLLTVSRIVLVPVFMAFILMDIPFGSVIAAFLFVCAAATDWLDGYIARRRNEITTIGKLLDPLADKLLISGALIALVETGQIHSWIAVLIIGREFLVTGLRGIAAAEGIVIAASSMAKIKTVTQIAAVFTLLVDKYIQALTGISPGIWVLYSALAFTLYTGYDYIAKAALDMKLT
jgi:CDP-diacylglycerol--glycerol-3-phosphate 3-phosphatidyltransferase